MKVYLTLDYELFFGSASGSASKCMLEPTEKLLEIASAHGIYLNFFVDGGYLMALEKYARRYASVAYEKLQIYSQIKKLADAGHDCQLHIHPHWEDSYYDGNGWKMNTNRYRLNQFTPQQIEHIVNAYVNITRQVSGKDPVAYRAGGWCLPEWHLVQDVFKRLNIWIDSTVFENGYAQTGVFDYDFRKAPHKDQWFFENNPLQEDSSGSFMELPITSVRLSPFFFWSLYLKGRLKRSLHKSSGDGIPALQKGSRNKVLTGYSHQALSCDGYYAGILTKQVQKLKGTNQTLVIIGHPKAQSLFSLQKLNEFINSVKGSCTFERYSDILR